VRVVRLFPRRVTRSPLLFWFAVAALALLTASVVAGALGRARSLAAQYGPLRPMVVAARPVERGRVLEAADLAVRMAPSSMLVPGALASVDDGRGRVVVVPLAEGEPLLAAHLAPAGLSGVAAQLAPGARAVSVPTGSNAPPLRRGDVVDVLATLEGEGGTTLAIAADAMVVDVGEGGATAGEAVTVAVSQDEARAVAYALAHGTVTVALTPGVASAQTAPRQPAKYTTSTAAPAKTR
jgi:Flp pilus assembly protein CpaB